MNHRQHPILFNEAMVRATIREIDPKTQTRRLPTRLIGFGTITEFGRSDTKGYDWHFRDKEKRWHDISHQRLLECCPYGKPGDRLWVREAWRQDPGEQSVDYRADGKPTSINDDEFARWTWKPSIHMRREYSRILLEITGVRVERVQDITQPDAKAEGIVREKNAEGDYGWIGLEGAELSNFPRNAFVDLWDSINAARGFGWDANPWVWVIEFKRVTN